MAVRSLSSHAGHDFHHVNRVRTMALRIADKEGGDREIIALAALVHDVGDYKFHETEEAGRAATFWLLADCKAPLETTVLVTDIAQSVSFKGLDEPDDMPSLEGKIVQDADRLDAIGAIGVARTFAYGGAKGRKLYDPTLPLGAVRSREEYLHGPHTSTFHHFFEKLLYLKNRLHTQTAREMAERRHAFMQNFVDQFRDEWNGEI